MPDGESGFDELFDKLGDIANLITQKQLLVRAVKAGAQPIKEEGARRAPDDPETPGSRIRQNMMITVKNPTPTSAIAQIGPSKKGFVGLFAEKGTKVHGKAHQPPRPFLGPSFDAMVDEAVEIMGAVLAAEIEEEGQV